MAGALAGIGFYDFRQKLLRGRVAVKNAVFAALFVIDDKLYGDAGLIWPVGLGRGFALAN